jgi:hypothetical protein
MIAVIPHAAARPGDARHGGVSSRTDCKVRGDDSPGAPSPPRKSLDLHSEDCIVGFNTVAPICDVARLCSAMERSAWHCEENNVRSAAAAAFATEVAWARRAHEANCLE